MVLGHFANRHFGERFLAEKHFAEQIFCRRTFCQTDICDYFQKNTHAVWVVDDSFLWNVFLRMSSGRRRKYILFLLESISWYQILVSWNTFKLLGENINCFTKVMFKFWTRISHFTDSGDWLWNRWHAVLKTPFPWSWNPRMLVFLWSVPWSKCLPHLRENHSELTSYCSSFVQEML